MAQTMNLEDMAVALSGKPNGVAVVPDLQINGQNHPAAAGLTKEQVDAILEQERKAQEFIAQQDRARFEALERQLLAAQAENDRLRASRPVGKLSLKISEKRALSVYGLSARFPVTLYKSQWKRLLAMFDEISQFLIDHDAELADKGDK